MLNTKKLILSFIMSCFALIIFSSSIFADNTSTATSGGSDYSVDSIILASDTTHNLSYDSASSSSNLYPAPAGELSDGYTVRKLSSEGYISFDISVLNDAQLTLEIEEIHNKSFTNFLYNVNVDGTEVYLRIFNETSSGPCHYFVNVPKELTNGKNSVRVTLKNLSNVSVSLNRVWGFSNISSLAAAEDIGEKMDVMFFDGAFMNGGRNTKEQMREHLLKYKEIFGENSQYEMYNIGFASEIYYMQLDEKSVYEAIDNIIELSRELDIPFSLNLNSWWSGSPLRSPDGEGGFFGDLKYQQLSYDPLNSNNRGFYQPSTPNVWSNTPWLSMNNDHYNQVRLEKYKIYTKYISEQLAKSQLQSEKPIPKFAVYVENEPVYWALFMFTTSINEITDVSSYVVDAAEKEGIHFDPTDGLNEDEENFLFNNLNYYMRDIMDAAAEGSGKDYIQINNGNMKLPDVQLIDNFYTHLFDTNEQRYTFSKYDMFETQLTKNGHLGLEGGGGEEARFRGIMDYVAARGKFSVVNIERGGLLEFPALPQYYSAGADFATIYNVQEQDQSLLAQSDGKQNDKLRTPYYGKEIFSYTLDEASKLVPNDVVVNSEGLATKADRRDKIAYPESANNEGYITFKIDNKDKPFTEGLYIQLKGRVYSAVDAGCKMELYAGNSLDDLKSVSKIYSLSYYGNIFNVSDFIDRASSVVYIKVRISTSSVSYLRSYSALFGIQALEPYSDTIGHYDGFEYSLLSTRQNNLLEMFRTDTEKLLADQKSACDWHEDYKKAEELYNQGKYKSAKQLLLGTDSLKLPAKFMVTDGGQLANYPVNVNVSKKDVPVSIILKKIGDSVKFEASSSLETDVEIKFSGKQGSYTLINDGDSYVLEPKSDGEITADKSGAVVVTLSLKKIEKSLPKTFSAYMSTPSNQSADKIYIASQNPEIGQYVEGFYLPLAKDASITRGTIDTPCADMEAYPREKLNEIKFGERVEVTLNDNNEVTNLKIRYGFITGKITKVVETAFPDMSSPFIEVEDVNTKEKFLFEIGNITEFSTSKTSATSFRDMLFNNGMGFKVGNEVNIEYIPIKTNDNDYYYATKIYEDYILKVDDNLNDSSCMDKLYLSRGIGVFALDDNNSNVCGLSSTEGAPGIAVWKITSDKPIKEVVVKYSGRSILGSNIKIYASANSFTYKKMGDLEKVFAHNFEQVFTCYADSSSIVGGNTIYVKAEIASHFQTTWAFLNSIQILVKV